jgi:hypothetical protein
LRFYLEINSPALVQKIHALVLKKLLLLVSAVSVLLVEKLLLIIG